ncbi:PKD domain-containing protein [Algoriphagus sp. oki45]|uniref:PKD domain-containing protein n=1 Tax=Algoriphagus sp. oki45 TaxID=3067294 RepID=UPI0030C77AB3
MQFNYKANLKWHYSYLGIFFVIFLLLPNRGNSQVSISREGYPYCEPFIGGIDDIRRPDVTLFGDGSGPGSLAGALTGQSIRLTANQQYKDGYVYLDLPFSPEYGIQVSFEYLSYGGTGADGIVFFMFDGAYGDLPPSLPFNIGGFGGSLGYAPRNNSTTGNLPGLSGAYIGVALDEWGNFISLESTPPNKPNGLGPNPKIPGFMRYPHTVGIRGPESNNYEVFDYEEVNIAPRPIADQFTIDTPFPGLTCSDPEYRKVYVNLSPRTDVGYDLTVDIRVGANVYRVIGPTHYNFAAPETIKLGFSAATGENTNYHEIRNLAVDVSKVEEAQRPEASDEFYRTCVDEELEIFIDVDLRSSDKAFIQCIQLYEDGLDINNPLAPWNTFSSDIDHTQCGLTPICISCTSDLSEKPTPLGTFTATIEDLDDSNFEDLRDRVQIVFTPNPGATGRSKIYYTITDNFGLTSKPKELVVIINPIPEFLAPPVIELPTCDGQNDGKITAEVGNLIPGFEHFWLYTNTAGVETNLGEGNVIGNVVSDGESAIFELEGVNVGQYVLVIRNPLDDGADGYCEDRLIVPIIEDELGTPVTVDQDTFEICEGETVTIVPEVDPVYLNGRTPTFKWYKDAAKTQPITSNPSTPAPDGFTYEINAQGHLIVNGLVSQGGNPFVYNYYVELEEDRTGSQNLCSILGDLEIAATVTVFPAVSFDPPVIENDWCLGNSGSIDIVFRRGNEVLSQYVLLDESGNEIRPVQSTGFFPGLSKGRYTVTGLASNPDCELSYDFEILGPDNTLELDVINFVNPSCELDNGSITWQASEGNGTYSFVSITGYPGASPPVVNQVGADIFEVKDLISAPSYTLTLTVQDTQGCQISSSQVITPQILPVFDVNDATVCWGQTATINVSTLNAGFPSLNTQFKWYADASATQEIGGGNPNPWGIDFSVNSTSGTLTASNFPASPSLQTFEVYIKPILDPYDPSNPVVCDLPILSATITVNPLPAIEIVRAQSASCFGGNDGIIEVNVSNGSVTDFEFMLDGLTPYQSSPVFNSGITAGNYSVRVRNRNTFCEDVIQVSIQDPSQLILTVTQEVDPSCDLDNGSLTFSIVGGTPSPSGTYSIQINGAALSTFTFTELSPNVFRVDNLPGGTYNILVQDQNACPATAIVDLVPQILPEYTLADLEVCENEFASILPTIVNPGSPDANPLFRWYRDAAATDEIISGVDAGLGMTFTVNQVNGRLDISNFAGPGAFTFYLKPDILNGCQLNPIPVTLNVNPLPTADFTPVSPLCFGESTGRLVLSAGGSTDYTYALVGNPIPFDSGTGAFEGLPSGNYQIEVTNSVTGCIQLIDVTIDPTPELLINLVSQQDPTCELDNGQFTFEILGGTPLSTGDYTVEINGTSLSSYSPTETSTNVYLIENLPGGTFEISVIDQNGCERQVFLDLIPQVLPEYTLEDLEVCENEFASILPTVVNPGSPDANPVYRWYRDAGATDEILSGVDAALGVTFIVDQGNGRLDISDFAGAGTFTFYLRPDILNGCLLDPVPVTLTVNPLPTADFTPVSPLCFGEANGMLVLSAGASSYYSYALVGNPTVFDSGSGAFEGLPSGNYQVEVTNTVTGCIQLIDVTIDPTPELIITQINQENPTCGASNGTFTFEVNGGVPDYSLTINGQAIADFDFVQTGNTYEIRSLAPGTYDVQVLDANDCLKALPTVTLVNDEGLTVVVTPQDLVLCEGATAEILPDIQAPVGAVFVIRWFKDASYTQAISSGDTDGAVSYEILTDNTLEVSGLITGDYTYYGRLQGAGICTIDFQSSVEILPPLGASLAVTPIICFGDSNGSVLVENPTGGSGSYEFSIDGNTWQTEPLFENLLAGTYQLDMRDLNGESTCYFTESFEILGPAGPIVLDDFNQFVASCGLDNGEIFNIEISGGWGNYTHQWTAGSPTGTPITGTLEKVENLAPGLYYLTVTDSGGCSEVFEFEIGTAPDPEYILIPPGDKCFGEQVALEAIHKAGDPNDPVARTEIAWYKNPNQSGLISDGPDPSNSDIVYTIVVDPNNFVNSTLLIDGLPTGTYTYYLYVECTGVEIPVTFEIFEFPAMTIAGVDESCYQANDGKIVVTGDLEPGMTFQVGSVTYTAAELANETFAPGDYAIEVQGAVCSQIFQVSILAATEIKAALIDSKDAACGLKDGYLSFEWEGGKAPYNLTLTSASGDTFTHQTSDLTYTFDGLGQGDYTLEIVDANGCNFNLSSPIAINNGPSEIIVDRVYSTCDGIPVTIAPEINPSNPNPIFTWYLGSISPGNKINNGFQQNGLTFNLNPRGNLTINGISVTNAPFDLWVTVDGPNICVGDQKQVTIEVFGNPEVQVTPVPEQCFGDGGSLILNIPTNQNIEFSLNGGPYQAYPTSVIDDLPQGTYSLSARNPSGCVIQIGNYVISGPSGPLEFQDLTAIGATCLSPNGQIFGTVAGGTSPYQVQVTSDSGPIDPSFIQWNGNNFVVDNLSLGAYTVTLTDANLCEVSETGLTVSNEPLKVATDDVTICEGEVAVLTPRVSGGQGGGLTYSWFKDANGLDEIPVGISTDGNITYDLSNRGILTITGLKNSDSPIPYYVELDINAACGRELERALVTVNPIPNLRTSNPSIVCDPTQTVDLSLYIDGFDPNRYDYEVLDGNGNALRLDEIRAISKTGIYRVRMKEKGSNCYTPTERILVRIAEVELVANFDYQVEIVPGQLSPYAEVGIGDQIIFNDLTQGNPIRWEWDFGDGNTSTEASPTHIYEEIGTFLVMLKTWDDLGCESTAIIELVITDNFDIIFPNAFTPDRADGKNNLFFPKHRGLSSLEFYVFTTWGELIYESSSLEAQGWDGTFRGQPAINGNYVYRAKYTSRGGFVGETAGVFVLIR